MTNLGALASPELGRREPATLLVPMGSIEQHGPHLPLDTDIRIAEAVTGGVIAATDGFVRGPTLPIGSSGEHAGFAGTLSLGSRTVTSMVVELVRSAGPEFSGVAIVNGHGGNADALSTAAAQCRSEGRSLAVWSPRIPGADAHAGRTETSLMLAVAPELVRLGSAEAGATEPLSTLMPRLREGGVRSVSPNGVLGDPTGASAGEGRRLLRALVDDAIRTLRDELAGG